MSIGSRITALRGDLNISGATFAQKVGISSAALLFNIEKGRNNISALQLKSICEEFSVDANWLLTGKGEKYLTNTTTKTRSSKSTQ